MKKITKSLLLPVLLLVLFACEKNTEDLNTDRKQQNTLLEKGFSTITPEERLQNIMQWTSFITAEAIHNNYGAGNEFIASLTPINLGSPSKKVVFNDLFTANNPEFMAAFESVFISYESNNWIHSNDTECGKPRGGEPLPPATGGIDDECTSESYLYCKFIQAITDLYCLEFYLPTGYQINQLGTNNPVTITSSAHPLNGSNSNFSYIHPGCQIGNNIINNANFEHHINPLIARPYTSTGMLSCNYGGEYIIDFTAFLAN
jgi:hypothetical protein